MTKSFTYQVRSPKGYMDISKLSLLEEYITNDAIDREYKRRLELENLSIYDGFFKGMKERRKFKRIVEDDIHFLFLNKLNNVQKQYGIKIEQREGEDFNEIVLEAKNSFEARSKLESALLDIENFLGLYGIDDKINCYESGVGPISRRTR